MTPEPDKPQHVTPSPVNVTTNIQRVVTDDGQTVCILQLFSPTGTHVSFWKPEALAHFGRTAIEAASGLIVAPPSNGGAP